MHILITGSSGQIGTNLALRLLERGHTVHGVDIRANTWTSQFPTQLQDLSLPYWRFERSIGHVEYPADLDLVVHLAAHAKVHELVEHPDRALANVTMTYNTLEFCRHNRLPLIYSSSREVYGDVRRPCTGEDDADFRFSESPYAASKIAGEAWVYAYARCYGLRYIVFRLSNVYGRYDNDLERMERVIPLFIRKIAAGEPVTIYGPEKLLDFTYVDDCVGGILHGIDLLASGEGADHTLNLAYGQGNSLVTLAEWIGESLGKAPRILLKPSREGEVTRYVADIGAARAILGYEPTTSLREGIPKTIAWGMAWDARHRPEG